MFINNHFFTIKKNKILISLAILTYSWIFHIAIPFYDAFIIKYDGVHPKLEKSIENAANLLGVKDLKRYKNLSAGFYLKRKDLSIGFCQPFKGFGNSPEISIYAPYWTIASESSKEALILHEMAHCLCFLGHGWKDGDYPEFDEDSSMKIEKSEKTGYLRDGCPMSLMFPSDFGENCYIAHKNYYINELRDRCKK